MASLENTVRLALQEHWKAVLIEGIGLALLGLAALVVPALAGLAFAILLGWLLLISGILVLAFTIWARKTPGFRWSLLCALLAIAAAVIVLYRPTQGMLALTTLLAAYFLAKGVLTIVYALEHRRELSERWSWPLASGVLDLILAGLIFAGLPGSAPWILGLLVGIELVFGGVALAGMAIAARNAARLRTNCGWGSAPTI